jgi:hypothetical protein
MDVNNLFLKFTTEIIILSITGIITAITVFLRKQIIENLAKIFERLFKWKVYSNSHFARFEVERDIRIQDMLAELRIQTKSDRAYVFQFHNGSLFSTKNQMWKLSNTHESVNVGIRPCIGELQNILSSSISDIILPLWQEDLSNVSGITKVSPENCGCPNKNHCVLPNGVFLYDVDNLKEGYSKGLLSSAAAKYILKSPLLDSENNRVGFVGITYCWEESNVNEIISCAETLCRTASKISYELRKK